MSRSQRGMSGLRWLLCLVLLGLEVEAEANENIKMCGRDLVRHAVSYCGHSRLKRAILTMEAPGHGANWFTTASVPEGGASPGPAPEEKEASGEREELMSLMARWLPLSARERRTALKISDLCCEKGCSKRELIQFC